MRRKNITLIGIITITIFAALAPAPILKKDRYRDYHPVKMSEKLKKEIREKTFNLKPYEISIFAKDKTRELLEFSPICEQFDDNRVTKMHCVGYAQVYSTICNYAFKVNGIKGTVRPVVGHILWNGINLNKISDFLPGKMKNFTKDHDFAEVKYEDHLAYIDPSLNIVNPIK